MNVEETLKFAGAEVLEDEILNLHEQINQLKYELAMVDEALARRPALDVYTTRYDKICAACEKAQEAENIRR